MPPLQGAGVDTHLASDCGISSCNVPAGCDTGVSRCSRAPRWVRAVTRDPSTVLGSHPDLRSALRDRRLEGEMPERLIGHARVRRQGIALDNPPDVIVHVPARLRLPVQLIAKEEELAIEGQRGVPLPAVIVGERQVELGLPTDGAPRRPNPLAVEGKRKAGVAGLFDELAK